MLISVTFGDPNCLRLGKAQKFSNICKEFNRIKVLKKENIMCYRLGGQTTLLMEDIQSMMAKLLNNASL